MKRKNYSPHTVKNYLNTLKHFVLWVNVPLEEVVNRHILQYIDFLLRKRLKPKTINCHLVSIRGFYEYLHNEEGIRIPNPVKRGYVLKQSKPLPKHLRDEEVEKLFSVIINPRDRAMFKVMLRCGLRVEEVANLALNALYLKRKTVLVKGKGSKDRVVYLSDDAYGALVKYLRSRPPSRAKKIFLVEKGTCKGKPISVRGIQKRMEHYARKAGVKSSSHQLRHTMATQLLNADMDLVSIQDLLGHSRIGTTERYIKVSNLKVMRDYFKAMDLVTKGSAYDVYPVQDNRWDWERY